MLKNMKNITEPLPAVSVLVELFSAICFQVHKIVILFFFYYQASEEQSSSEVTSSEEEYVPDSYSNSNGSGEDRPEL